MRKYLGVLAGMAALSVMSWAQTPAPVPAQTPPPAQAPAPEPTPTTLPTPVEKPPAPPIPFPRLEIFGGYSHAEAGPFNAGHWAGLNGWEASFGLNATHWLGFIVDGGQFYGTSQIPVGQQAPFPSCGGSPSFCPTGSTFGAATKEYQIIFGAQFSRRKSASWTPFGEILYGHGGTRGQASAQGQSFTEVGTGPAFVAGGGVDHKINERFALRLKADYLRTTTSFQGENKQKQDNFRFSIGLVIKSVHKKKRKLEDETQPEP